MLDLEQILAGHYRVVKALGEGGLAKTYIVEDLHRPGNPQCAVKYLKPASSDSTFLPTARRLFNREAETLEKLGEHDQIPRLLAYFEEKQEFYLVQEFIAGHTLDKELPVGHCWSESKVIQLLLDVLPILEFVHSYEVIHRDIKPNNLIRRDKDGRLVLIDFGAVKQIRDPGMAAREEVSHTTVSIGTQGYMPTEQVRGKPRFSSDLYALGMIAIQALTGTDPIHLPEDAEGEVIWRDRAHVTPELAAILNKMVRYHFKDRYQSVTEVLQAIQSLAASPTQKSILRPTGVLGDADAQPAEPSILKETRVLGDAQASPAEPSILKETRVLGDVHAQPAEPSILRETRVAGDVHAQPAEQSILRETRVAGDVQVQPSEQSILRETRVAGDVHAQPAEQSILRETRVAGDAQVQPSEQSILRETRVAGDAQAQPSEQPILRETRVAGEAQVQPSASEDTSSLRYKSYRIIQTLSYSKLRQTYLAENASQPGNPRCLIKRLSKSNIDDPSLATAQRLFQKEAESLEKLGEYDQIPRLIDHFDDEKAFYLVQEFIEGHPLSRELLPHRPFHWTETEVIELLREVLSILDFVHSQGMIHRDIKPENLIRRQQDNRLVLVDFGAVKEFQIAAEGESEQVSPTVSIGTPGYMPTEQGRGKPRPSSDIYALGAIAIQALTGRHPKQLPEDPDTGEILWRQYVQVSDGLAAVLTKMVRYHFKDRYQSAREALQSLNQLTEKSESPIMSPKFGKRLAVGVAMVVAVGAIGIGSWLFLESRPPQLSYDPNKIDESKLKGDYSKLQEDLQKQDWRAADRETYEVMLKVAGTKSEADGRFDLKEWGGFSCDDLKKIDSLWYEASNGKLGLSVQWNIFQEVKKDEDSFKKAVKWSNSQGNNVVAWEYNEGKAQYLPQNEPDYQNPPKGHLPAMLEWENGKDSRFKHTDRCGIK